MRAKYSDGICQNAVKVRSDPQSWRENCCEIQNIYRSGDFCFDYRWNWGKIPRLIEDYEISSVACGADGLIYAATRFRDHPVAVFREDGTFLRYLGSELEVCRVHGISTDDEGCIWLVDEGNHVCIKLSPGGEVLMTLGRYGVPGDSGASQLPDLGALRYLSVRRRGEPFNHPTKLVVGPDKNLYVADGYANCAVHVFSPDGTLLRSWGAPGSAAGEFLVVHSLVVDPDLRVWVADPESCRVQIFTGEGELMKVLEELMAPVDLACDGEFVYVSELDSRISIYDARRMELVSQIGERDGEFHGHGIAVDREGNLYISQLWRNYHLSKLERVREG